MVSETTNVQTQGQFRPVGFRVSPPAMLVTTTRELEISITEPDTAVMAPTAVVFEHVSLAFDEHVVRRDSSFSVPNATMRILLGACRGSIPTARRQRTGVLCPEGA